LNDASRKTFAKEIAASQQMTSGGIIMWSRLRYTVWAPAYDTIVGAAGFNAARRLSIDRLQLALAKPLFSDLNRRLGPLLADTPLSIEHDEPAAFGGTYRVVTVVNSRRG
jgi:hypothetical protein